MSAYHEPVDELTNKDRDFSRALNSLKEEIEAVDWYQQRVATTTDPELQKIVAHNRDEEIEHAVMVLEWLRRNMPGWDEQMRTYLFTTKPVTELEDEEGEGGDKDLGIGKLK
ncbi:MAG: ferritin-like domain-containing protein [Candidatus Cloacimonetes bacterium]|nr:ferritin-like domain-containing protein [Candidatus Cloacimonadota bacterium]